MFLDIAFGVFGSYITGTLFNEAVTVQLTLLGIVFVLLPDIDIIWHNKNKNVDHRSLLHYPLLYIVTSLVVALTCSTSTAFLFFITTLFHFVHDTFILGWGVAWFAPFSLRRYKFFPDNGRGGFLKEKYMTWLPGEQKVLEEKLCDSHWIRNWYGRVTVVSVVEYSAFLMACVYSIYTFVL